MPLYDLDIYEPLPVQVATDLKERVETGGMTLLTSEVFQVDPEPQVAALKVLMLPYYLIQ